jgi:hypothetical protein
MIYRLDRSVQQDSTDRATLSTCLALTSTFDYIMHVIHCQSACDSDEVLAVSGGAGSSGEAVVEGRPFFPLALSTTGGATVQLLFEHQAHCKVWTASVQGICLNKSSRTP